MKEVHKKLHKFHFTKNQITKNLSLAKVRIRIQPERIRVIPSNSEICFQIILNQSKKLFGTRSMQIGYKSILLDPINSSSIRDINLNKSDWAQIYLNRIFNPNQSEPFRLRVLSDWFSRDLHRTELNTIFWLVRNDSERDSGMARNSSH